MKMIAVPNYSKRKDINFPIVHREDRQVSQSYFLIKKIVHIMRKDPKF